MSEHYTAEADCGLVDATQSNAVEEALKKHHLATADPEPERDGLMTGPAHEKKYDLERAEDSEARWRAVGVHPFENRALRPGEDGAENLRGAANDDRIETTDAGGAPENAAAARASDNNGVTE